MAIPIMIQQMDGEKVPCTKDLLDELCTIIEAGAPFGRACTIVGLDSSSVMGARKKSAEIDKRIQQSRSRCMLRWIQNINRASDSGVWTASAWMLERSFPEEFGNRLAIKGTLDMNEHLVVELPKLDAAKRKRLLDELYDSDDDKKPL